ncbi:MAG: methytransferase partner Trm112 [Chloroflexi bacterium]|nr:methytransferase partner Trm112 [Chloroflexota bacterium]
MKRDIIDFLVCPVCKGTLRLQVHEEDAVEVVQGELTCPRCARRYAIEAGIPNMMPPAGDAG